MGRKKYGTYARPWAIATHKWITIVGWVLSIPWVIGLAFGIMFNNNAVVLYSAMLAAAVFVAETAWVTFFKWHLRRMTRLHQALLSQPDAD